MDRVAKLETFNFAPHSRENRITEIKLSVESSDNTVKIYKDLAKVNSGLRNTLIFAPSYIHAFEMAHSMVENNQAQEWRSVDLLKLEKYILKIQNPLLKNLLPKGIAVFYSGMARVDRLIVERLFESKSIGVLFCTMDTSKLHQLLITCLLLGHEYMMATNIDSLITRLMICMKW